MGTEFNSLRLFYKANNSYFGNVGEPTNLIDEDGETLHIGDVVILTELKSGQSRLRFVAESKGVHYIMGAYVYTAENIPHIANSYKYKKAIGYEGLSKGFKLLGMEYV